MSDWSSDVCSSDLHRGRAPRDGLLGAAPRSGRVQVGVALLARLDLGPGRSGSLPAPHVRVLADLEGLVHLEEVPDLGSEVLGQAIEVRHPVVAGVDRKSTRLNSSHY